jgi:hypothetical protein
MRKRAIISELALLRPYTPADDERPARMSPPPIASMITSAGYAHAVPAIPDGYPFSLPDETLDTELERMIAIASQMNERFENLLPELKLLIIQAGLHERSRRETESMRKSSSQAASRALLVSVVALIVAVVCS